MSVQTQLEAYAFRQLVDHLQANTDVQNIDIMNLTGFCRNCLSKWYHAAAVRLGYGISYEEACEVVYGMPYVEWKKRYQTKATEEQLALFKANKHRHAKHDKTGGAPPKEAVPQAAATGTKPEANAAAPAPPSSSPTRAPKPSSACCDPGGGISTEDLICRLASSQRHHGDGQAPEVRLGVLTVSDRASQGVYEDLSGPEVEKCVQLFGKASTLFTVASVTRLIVPDEPDEVAKVLKEWSAAGGACNVVLTTGGTGLSKRDTTPEATREVVDRLVPGITEAIRVETSRMEPMAMLSRAVAGIRNQTLIVNLPGRPKAVRESLGVLLPVLHHAVAELEKVQGT